MYSIYLTTGQLAVTGPNGKPYTDISTATTSAVARNAEAVKLGIKARYEVGPGKESK